MRCLLRPEGRAGGARAAAAGHRSLPRGEEDPAGGAGWVGGGWGEVGEVGNGGGLGFWWVFWEVWEEFGFWMIFGEVGGRFKDFFFGGFLNFYYFHGEGWGEGWEEFGFCF